MQKLYYGGPIITMEDKDRECDYPECVLTENGMIQFVGDLKKADQYMKENASKSSNDEYDDKLIRVDLKGKTLIPAFIDPHSHISLVAQFSDFANLSNCTNYQEIVDTLKKYKEDHQIKDSGIILGCSYDHNFLEEQAHPNAKVLDQVSTSIPVFIFHISNHMGVANSKLLELAHVTKETKDPEGGQIGRNQDGTPNGYVEESPALAMVMKDVFGRVKADFATQMKKAQQIYLSHGITTVQDGASDFKTFAGITELAKKEELYVDIISYLMTEEYEHAVQEYPQYQDQYQNHVKIGGAKIILDGSPQGKTAWMSKPYEGEEEYCGYPTHSEQEVEEALKNALVEHHQLLAHCNGDAAAQMYIDCYRNALAHTECTSSDIRPVMIHAQTVRDDQLKQMKELGMIPSFFIAHTYYWGDVHLKNLGQKRGSHISPAKTALELGIPYNFHQDSPVLEPDMIRTIWCAVNRVTRSGKTIGMDQRINAYDALKGVTINAAYAYHEEDIKGSIHSGKQADFCILSDNPIEIDPLKITDIQVVETIKKDMTVYHHASHY